MTIEIKNISGKIILTVDSSYLSRADLSRADLRGADLSGAIGIMCAYVPGMSSRGDYVYAIEHSDGLRIKAGCWWGTSDEFRLVAGDRPMYLNQLAVFEAAYMGAHDPPR